MSNKKLSDALSSDNLQSNIIPCHRRLLSVSGEQINTQLLNATADRSQAWTGYSAHTACIVKLLSMNTALYYTVVNFDLPGCKYSPLFIGRGYFLRERSFVWFPCLQNGPVHILMTWFTWLIWIACSIKCFFWPGSWGQHPIYNQVYASYSVHLDKCKPCQLCAKNFQKVGIFDQICIVLESFNTMLVFLCEYSVLYVSVKGFEQKTGWESKKSLPLAHDTHFAVLWQRIEGKNVAESLSGR